jgi:tetratricopeptide (TPR) repeat protein
MSNDKSNAPAGKQPAGKTPVTTSAAKPVPVKVPPLFRKIDWLVLAVIFGVVWTAYLFTLAPELTLEDSGELCTASYYAGIPHPPGYPFWAIYSWLWTVIVPFGNVAWRVEVGESFAAAMACGLVGFMVSRGSSMLIEGIDELKDMSRKWENVICVVTGIVAGLMLGFDRFMWMESVVINRISLFDVPWIMVVALCLFRWIYAPQQKRYLYIGMFFFGVCATIHQTMLVAAMGIEVCIAIALPRLGRDLFLGNSIVFALGLIGMETNKVQALNDLSPMFKNIFYFVGLGSVAGFNWIYISSWVQTKRLGKSWQQALLWPTVAIAGVFLLWFFLLMAFEPNGDTDPLSFRAETFNKVLNLGGKIMEVCVILYGGILAVCTVVCFWTGIETRELGREWKAVLFMGLLWTLGAAFYFYEPLAGMSDPPMQWGYPRTVEGFFHALSRGQYEKSNPTDIIQDPMRFISQLGLLISGLADSFGWVYLFIASLPFFFLWRMKNRERAWIIGLAAIYLCIGVLLTIIMNTSLDRQNALLCEVFFTASHAVVAIMIGYGLALLAAYMATHYERFRNWGLIGGAIATVLALYCLVSAMGKLYFGPAGEITGVHEFFSGIIRAFDKNQYGSPVFANLILVATPLIFIAALLLYRNRAPVVITLCIFATAPVYSSLSHWYKSEQRNHWFGYWFGHDMFTPPFGIYPEMSRNTILFGGTDPGRFCPTYMIFCESFIPHSCQPLEDQKFDRRDVYLITQNALADGTYLDYLRAQYFRSQQKDPPFFSRFIKYIAVTIGIGNPANVIMDGIDMGKGDTGNSLVDGIANLLDSTLDKPLTALGASIEKRRRAEGVYPPKEIYIPSPLDSQNCFQEYTEDVAHRQQLGQLKPGEEVHADAEGHVQVSGQVAVMEINGLLCKVIFDHNPTNDFYVEESFPLDWMYPYETPSGIIMKINRNPLPELTDDIFKKDHEFWSKYSERLCGNWITYDTTVQQIADFAEKVYLGNNYEGYTGDRKFIRDDDGQKAFSKLRSSIAGVYAWRLTPQCPPEYRQKTQASQQALIKETDFAFKQSFAFCPYSPEAVFRYVNFLLGFQRFDDALIVAKTCQKLDPYNDQVSGLIAQLENYKKQYGDMSRAQNQMQQMQSEATTNPADLPNILGLAGTYLQMQQTNAAISLFDEAITNAHISTAQLGAIASFYAESGRIIKLEGVLGRIVVITPDQPEPRYDFAAVEAVLGKTNEALENLKVALDLNAKRLKANPAATDLLTQARTDGHLNSLRNLPEFQKLVPSS